MASSTHDPNGWRWLPARTSAIDPRRVQELLASEQQTYIRSTPGSAASHARAADVLPLGVPSSFQHWDPHPLSIKAASGAWLTDVDDRNILDLSMGFGAVLVGHLHPAVVDACSAALRTGTLFVTPAPVTVEAAERVARRFSMEQLRFTNSGTESLMYAIRAAKAFTGRSAIAKIEGGYHGGYDPLTVSAKPSLQDAGPAERPNTVAAAAMTTGPVHVVGYNDLESLADLFNRNGDNIAALVMEPVLENIAIVLPDAGYLAGVRALCDQYGVVLIFDEVKTGLTAGVNGASSLLGVRPDLITLAKSISGGLPVGAFGGRKDIMSTITSGSAAHFGTFNGNPLAMAAVIAVDDIVTADALNNATTRNMRTLNHMGGIIDAYQLPAHTVGFGVKGCVTWASTPVRNYRDYKQTDFELAELHWLWNMNRCIATPPGLDEQWLVSFAHTETDMELLVSAFEDLAKALRS